MIYSGFQAIDPNKIKLAQTFGASKAQILTKVVLLSSVPTLIAALKVNAGLSLVGVVVGEFQSANLGLGYLIQYGSQIFKMNIVMAAVTILAIISSLMYLAISWLEAAVMRRRLAQSPRRPARLGRLEPRDSLVGSSSRRRIRKGQKVVQRGSVLFVGQRVLPSATMITSIIEHHRVARGGSAADIGYSAAMEQGFRCRGCASGRRYRTSPWMKALYLPFLMRRSAADGSSGS